MRCSHFRLTIQSVLVSSRGVLFQETSLRSGPVLSFFRLQVTWPAGFQSFVIGFKVRSLFFEEGY